MGIDLPKIKIYKNQKLYRIKWWTDNEQYVISFKDKMAATLAAAKIKLALSGAAEWPPELLRKSVVQKYLSKGKKKAGTTEVLEEYLEVIRGDVTGEWVDFTKHCMQDLSEVADLQEILPVDAQKYISRIGQAQSVSTRNKKLLVIKKFYNWAMKTHFWPQNPFADIKKLRAVKINTDIDYLTRDEREVVLEAAAEKKHGLAVWVALYTGMRRGEAFSLRWSDINFETETVIAQSKGGHPNYSACSSTS